MMAGTRMSGMPRHQVPEVEAVDSRQPRGHVVMRTASSPDSRTGPNTNKGVRLKPQRCSFRTNPTGRGGATKPERGAGPAQQG